MQIFNNHETILYISSTPYDITKDNDDIVNGVRITEFCCDLIIECQNL